MIPLEFIQGILAVAFVAVWMLVGTITVRHRC
jgi:hypothetical protein